MDRYVEQIGNTILVRDLSTNEIQETIGAQFFSFEFNAGTIQLVDSSKANLVYTIPLSELYKPDGSPLATEEDALNWVSTFFNAIGGVKNVTGNSVDNTDPFNPVVNPYPFTEEETLVSGSADPDSWVSRDLGPAYANKELRIIIATDRNNLYRAGVRAKGSPFNLITFAGRGSHYTTVVTDGAGAFQLFGDSEDLTYTITGTRPLI